MFRDKLQRLKETLIFRYASITVSYLSACSSLSYLGRQISAVIVKSYFSLLPSLEKRFIAHAITYLIPSVSVFQREKKKDCPPGRFIPQKHKLFRSDARRQIMVITLLEQTVLTFLPKNAWLCQTLLLQQELETTIREKFLLKIGKNQIVSARVWFLLKMRSFPFHNMCEKHTIHQGNYTEHRSGTDSTG